MLFLSSGELPQLLSTYGYWLVAAAVALESMGIPVPGETTLIAAAVLAGAGNRHSIWPVIAAAAGGAILGDNIGFWVGRWAGIWLLLRYGRCLRLTERRIKLGRYLFRRHGGKVVFFGRFVAVLRTFAAFLAGANDMPWPRFLLCNATGGIAWAAIYGLGAYFLGEEASRLTEPAAIALGVVAAIVIIAAAVFLHRHEARLAVEAEKALPGPLRKAGTGKPG
jgi:membrane protein DedA with SNARE-associated domain